MKLQHITARVLCILFILAMITGCNENGTNALPESEEGSSASDQEGFASGEVIQLTNVEDRANRFEPDIDGDKIVWAESSAENTRILFYDISTQEGRLLKTIQITNGPPKIFGNRVVWSESVSLFITLYNLTTGTEELIDSNGLNPEIHGNHIVWAGPRLQKDINLYDTSMGLNTRITAEVPPQPGSAQDHPAIWGDIIVWEDLRNGNFDIFKYNLASETEEQITNDGGHQRTPAIWETRIVWVDERNGNADIFMYDLETETETQITDDPADQIDPAIFGNYIVWEDYRNGNWDIFLYDLSTGKETQITYDPKDQFDPAISGNTLVWAGICESMMYSDIFIYKIPMIN